MPSLYTVNFKTKKIITRYDAKGRAIETKEEFVEQTLHDLPANCAQKYVDVAGATMTQQFGESNPYTKRGKTRVKFDYQSDNVTAIAQPDEPRKTKRKSSKPADYADLVNTMMEKSA